jgi:hypothetical protein
VKFKMATKKAICPKCLSSDCTFSDLIDLNDKLAKSLGFINEELSRKPLHDLIAQLEADRIIANNDEGQRMIKMLKELAVEFSLQENKARQVVRTIQSYGENCKEAAEDFLEDGNVGDRLDEVKDIEETKRCLQDVAEMHQQIK